MMSKRGQNKFDSRLLLKVYQFPYNELAGIIVCQDGLMTNHAFGRSTRKCA